MKRGRRSGLAAAATSVVWLMAIVEGTIQSTVTVSGSVMSKDGVPLHNVGVVVMREGQSVRDRTGRDGSYSVEIARGGSFGVAFLRTDLDPVVIEELVGTRSHAISTVMHRTGQTRSKVAVAEVLEGYEAFLAQNVARDMGVSEEELRMRARLLERMWIPRNATGESAEEEALTELLEARMATIVASLEGETEGR